jgi:FkbM family methyltransferase
MMLRFRVLSAVATASRHPRVRQALEKIPFGLDMVRVVRDRLVRLLAPGSGELVIHTRGLRLAIPAEESCVYHYVLGEYEPVTSSLFEEACHEGAYVLDIGACVGFYSLLAARRVGARGKVVAVEPDPSNYGLLRKNIEMNGLSGVVAALQVAVSRPGEDSMWLYRYRYPGYHSLHQDPVETLQSKLRVPSATVDAIVERFFGGKVDVVKMDIEGHEVAALEGMGRTFEANATLTLFVEWNPARLRDAGVDPKGLVLRLTEWGFRVRIIDEVSRSVRPISYSDLEREWPRGKFFNLVCER